MRGRQDKAASALIEGTKSRARQKQTIPAIVRERRKVCAGPGMLRTGRLHCSAPYRFTAARAATTPEMDDWTSPRVMPAPSPMA